MKQIKMVQEEVRELVLRLTEKLSDEEYIEVLEEIEADINGMIECKKEEIRG